MRRTSHLIASLALGFAGTMSAWGADAVPEPSQYLPADPLAILRLTDLPRSRQRFFGSPYAKLLETPWGQLAKRAFENPDPATKRFDLSNALATMRRLVAGVSLVADRPGALPIDWAVAVTTEGDTAPLQNLCRALFPVEAAIGAEPGAGKAWVGGQGQISQLGDLFVFRSAQPGGGKVEAPAAASPASAGIYPDSCLEALVDAGAMAKLLARLGQPQPQAATGSGPFTLSLKLDPIGIREHAITPMPAGDAAAWKALTWPVADRALLNSLPKTTLFAFVGRADRATTIKGLDLMGMNEGSPSLAQIDALMVQAGLPPYRDLIGALDGDLVMYCEESAPFPVFTLALGMQETEAKSVLQVLQTKVGMVLNQDGTQSGILGIISLHAAFRDKQLVLTTNPLGIDGWTKRTQGFADHPEIQSALSEVPQDAMALGASRSGASWGALAQIAMLPLSQLNVPQLMSLPQDLRAAGRYGFIYYQRQDDGFVIESGGLFGGPFSFYTLVGGGGLGFALMRMNAVMQQGADPAAGPGEGGAKDLVF